MKIMSSGTHIDPEKLNGRGKEATRRRKTFFQSQIKETEKKKAMSEGK